MNNKKRLVRHFTKKKAKNVRNANSFHLKTLSFVKISKIIAI